MEIRKWLNAFDIDTGKEGPNSQSTIDIRMDIIDFEQTFDVKFGAKRRYYAFPHKIGYRQYDLENMLGFFDIA